MKIKIYIAGIFCLGAILLSFTNKIKQTQGCVDPDNCLELNGEFFGLNQVYNRDSTYFSYGITTDSQTYIKTPGLYDYVPTESLESGAIIYLDYPVDSLKVDFDLGKIKLKDNQIPEDLKMRMTVDGSFCWIEDVEVVFISENSREYRINMMKDLNIILKAKKNNIPDYILIKRIGFFGGKLHDKYLFNSFLFEIDKEEE